MTSLFPSLMQCYVREEQAMFQCKAVAHVLLAKILGVAAKSPVLSRCFVALEIKN